MGEPGTKVIHGVYRRHANRQLVVVQTYVRNRQRLKQGLGCGQGKIKLVFQTGLACP